MENRFLQGRTYGSRGQLARAQAWSQTLSAEDRRLVVLTENGGVDLRIPALVDAVLSSPGLALVVSAEYRERIVEGVRDRIKQATDGLLESAELVLNRYRAAKPGLFGDVVVLRDGTASYEDLKRTLLGFSRAGKLVDLLVLTHGSADYISVAGGIDRAKIEAMSAENGKPLSIRSVYMMSCVGSSLNGAWLAAGAKASSGSLGDNVLPEPTTHFFWKAWSEGQTFEAAATSAYRKTVNLINDVVRGLVRALPIPGIGLVADQLDVGGLRAIADSAPTVSGRGGVTITSDDLSFDQSKATTGLTTTVLPSRWLRALGSSDPEDMLLRPGNLELLRRWERPESGTWDEASSSALRRKADAAARVIRETITVPLSSNQLDALVSFACGIGLESFRGSTLVKRLNAGDVAGAAAELRKWTKSRRDGALVDVPELTARREEEAALFLQPVMAVGRSLTLAGAPRRFSYVFSSPSRVMSADPSRWAVQQNPAAPVIAGMAVTDAAQIGLGAVYILQAGLNASSGSFTLTYDRAQRLLGTEARVKMPGAQQPRKRYTRELFWIASSRINSAEASVIAEWEGNAYGEIGTVVIRLDLKNSTEWSKSSATITINKVDRIPLPNTDPRTWPIVYAYGGSYDPWSNGLFEFSGEFEVNAFGGLKFNRHEVYSRSAIDFLVFGKPEDYVVKGADVIVPVPEIPQEQLEYVKTRLP